MFRHVPACSGMFRNVPCSGFWSSRYLWCSKHQGVFWVAPTCGVSMDTSLLHLRYFRPYNANFQGISYGPGVSIISDNRRNASAMLLREVGYFFLQKKKQLQHFNNVVNKKHILTSQ